MSDSHAPPRALARGHFNTPSDPRLEDAEFQAACGRHDYAQLQAALDDMTKRDAVDHLVSLFPHRPREWFRRNLARLMALTPDDLARFITYNDPTGETATRRALRAAA